MYLGLLVSRVYFGNWLRDYSQAMDVAGLSKLPKQTIINLVMGLGFLAHGVRLPPPSPSFRFLC